MYNRCRLTEQPLNLDNPEKMHWPINWDVDQLCDNTCEGLVGEGEVTVCGNPLEYKVPL